jgi:homoserine O-acetyltransferase/O-succinyltransferase
VRTVVPMAAPAATGALAMAWNAIQLEMIDALGERGLGLARQLAMTTYRSEADFEGRFGRQQEPDGRLSIASYLDYQGRKLVERFDPDTYRILVRAMDLHDIGRDRGGIVAALRVLGPAGSRMIGLGIRGDILYGPTQVHALVDAARSAGVTAAYRELASTKGHDAFLVEWDQLGAVLSEALDAEAVLA